MCFAVENGEMIFEFGSLGGFIGAEYYRLFGRIQGSCSRANVGLFARLESFTQDLLFLIVCLNYICPFIHSG